MWVFSFSRMAYYIYIIQSQITKNYYTGSCEDIPLRIERHNLGWTKSTKAGRPWDLVYSESYDTKSEALKREREIKRMKSRAYIERLTAGAEGRPDF
jgi:putative endonuclease